MSVNRVLLVGFVGKDAELRYLKPDFAVARFTLATNYAPQGQSTQEQTEWHTVVAFGAQASFAELWVRTGQLIAVEGRISYRGYTDKQGIYRKETEIVADRLTFAGNPPKDYIEHIQKKL